MPTHNSKYQQTAHPKKLAQQQLAARRAFSMKPNIKQKRPSMTSRYWTEARLLPST